MGDLATQMKEDFINSIMKFKYNNKINYNGKKNNNKKPRINTKYKLKLLIHFNKFIISSFNIIYWYRPEDPVYRCSRMYDFKNINSMNNCLICLPFQSILIYASVKDALNLSGVNLYFQENQDKYLQFDLFDIENQIEIKSPKIIVSNMELDSIIDLNINKSLYEIINKKI